MSLNFPISTSSTASSISANSSSIDYSTSADSGGLWARTASKVAREMVFLGMDVEVTGVSLGRWNAHDGHPWATPPAPSPPLAEALMSHEGLLSFSPEQMAVEALAPLIFALTAAQLALDQGYLPRADENLGNARRLFDGVTDAALSKGLPESCALEAAAVLDSLSLAVSTKRERITVENKDRLAVLSVLVLMHLGHGATRWPELELIDTENAASSWRSEVVAMMNQVLMPSWSLASFETSVRRGFQDWAVHTNPRQRAVDLLPIEILRAAALSSSSSSAALESAWNEWRKLAADSLPVRASAAVDEILGMEGLVVIDRYRLARAIKNDMPYGPVRALFATLVTSDTSQVVAVDPCIAAFAATAEARSLSSLIAAGDAVVVPASEAGKVLGVLEHFRRAKVGERDTLASRVAAAREVLASKEPSLTSQEPKAFGV